MELSAFDTTFPARDGAGIQAYSHGGQVYGFWFLTHGHLARC